jgi:hypothetical protein
MRIEMPLVPFRLERLSASLRVGSRALSKNSHVSEKWLPIRESVQAFLDLAVRIRDSCIIFSRMNAWIVIHAFRTAFHDAFFPRNSRFVNPA